MVFLQLIAYYLVLIPLSLLPLRILYLKADFLYFLLYKVIKYRRGIVTENLSRSFPEKNEEEITRLSQRFYRYLCDLIVESVKTFTMSEKEILKRYKVRNPELIALYYKRNTNVIAATGHYGNWEWTALAIAMLVPYKVLGVYRPLKNKFFDKKLRTTRGRFGLILTPQRLVKRYILKHKNALTFTAFIADQMPSNKWKCYWTNFLNQDTQFFYGLEKMARDFDTPVLFARIYPIRRGHYELEFEVLTESPSKENNMAIMKKYTSALESLINEKPEYWLWTHKRWKNKRPDDYKTPTLHE